MLADAKSHYDMLIDEDNDPVRALDLSIMPEGTDEKYKYLYDLTVVDDSLNDMAHPDTVLLKNGNILTVYPVGHGKGAVLNKISTDGGVSWSQSIENTPKSWENSREPPRFTGLNLRTAKRPTS